MLSLILIHLLITGTSCTSNFTEECTCLNGGFCNLQPSPVKCSCPASFIGENCHLNATRIDTEATRAVLTRSYSYLYFEPQQVNYYRLLFDICMVKNPSNSSSLFYIQSERSDGSLRGSPSLFQSVKITLEAGICATFSTHYISVKPKVGKTYTNIVIGMKMFNEGEDNTLKQYFNRIEKFSKSSVYQVNQTQTTQEIIIKMKYEIYLESSYYSNFIFLLVGCFLLLLITIVFTCLRRKYAHGFLDSMYLTIINMHLGNRSTQHNLANTQEIHRRKNLQKIEAIMPVSHYSKEMQISIIGSEQTFSDFNEREVCSICLVDIQLEEQIRTTPCKHHYHRDCIDNWCQNHMSCPYCRRSLLCE